MSNLKYIITITTVIVLLGGALIWFVTNLEIDDPAMKRAEHCLAYGNEWGYSNAVGWSGACVNTSTGETRPIIIKSKN
jgi:hypothetical protein